VFISELEVVLGNLLNWELDINFQSLNWKRKKFKKVKILFKRFEYGVGIKTFCKYESSQKIL